MKQLNTLAIEDFLDKARIAIKTNQKTLTLPITDVVALQNSLMIVMTRLSGELDKALNTTMQQSAVEIKMDGGKF
jgi:hypothetical protein